MLCIVALYAAAFVAAGFAFDSPERILSGLAEIVLSRDTLITDYMGVGGIGAATDFAWWCLISSALRTHK